MKFEIFGIRHLLPLLNGMLVTLRICGITILFSTILGLVIGIAMTSHSKLLRTICKGYVNVVRGIPLLVIIFFVFYGIPMVFKLDVSQNAASIGSLTFYSSAYIAEIVRGSIQSIHKGQSEAAIALGMNTIQRMCVVILPQAFRLMIPPLVGFLIALIKDSSLVSAIGYIDLTRAGKIVGNLTINPLLSFTFVALFYFIICFLLSKLAKYSEKALSKNMRGGARL